MSRAFSKHLSEHIIHGIHSVYDTVMIRNLLQAMHCHIKSGNLLNHLLCDQIIIS